jgi:hypothetical protein
MRIRRRNRSRGSRATRRTSSVSSFRLHVAELLPRLGLFEATQGSCDEFPDLRRLAARLVDHRAQALRMSNATERFHRSYPPWSVKVGKDTYDRVTCATCGKVGVCLVAEGEAVAGEPVYCQTLPAE